MGWKKWTGIGCVATLLGTGAACTTACLVVRSSYRKINDDISTDEKNKQIAYANALKAENPDLFPTKDNQTVRIFASDDPRNKRVYMEILTRADTVKVRQDGTHLFLNGKENPDPIQNSLSAGNHAMENGSPYVVVRGQGEVVLYRNKRLTPDGKRSFTQINDTWDVNSAQLVAVFREAKDAKRSKEFVLSTSYPCHVLVRASLLESVLENATLSPDPGLNDEYKSDLPRLRVCETVASK